MNTIKPKYQSYVNGCDQMLRSLILCFVITSVFSSLFSLTVLTLNYADAKSRDIVTLKQGQKLILDFEKHHLRPIKAVTLSIKSIDPIDPFTHEGIPLTLEVLEKNQLIGSESFTSGFGANYKKVQIDVNNLPKIQGNFRIAITFDTPEFDSDDSDGNILKIDVNSVKFNDGRIHMHQHTDVKIIPAS